MTYLEITAMLDRALIASVSLICAVAMTGVAASAVAAKSRASYFKLKNGMEVVVIPDHRSPVVTHMVWYRVGGADEPRGSSGIAHFLEHLMFKGTKEIPPGEFSKVVARNGGQDNAFTSNDVTAYFQRLAKDRLPLMMKMEADRMANLSLRSEDVLTERKVILEERRSRVDNDPSSILNEQMMATLYQSHPYGVPVIGWEHEVAQLDHDDALNFYKRYYAPNNAILVVAGDTTADEVRKLAEATFGKVKPVPDTARLPRPQEPRHYAPLRVELEDPRAGRSTVQRFYLAPGYSNAAPGEAEAIELMMRVVASGTTSRLYKALVVEQKKAASAGGWYTGAGIDGGRIGLYAVAPGDTPVRDVEAALDAVIDEIALNGVTQEELDRARKAHLATFIYESDSQSSLARRYGWSLATGRTIEDIEAMPERLRQVTLADVNRAARTVFDKKRSVTGILTTGEPQPTADAPDGTPRKGPRSG
ncbi:MAG: pitrilysin family protein [Pseudomonadota bacterium]|nr:pitrilysin family protein [Pseudomonadota bacterium]